MRRKPVLCLLKEGKDRYFLYYPANHCFFNDVKTEYEKQTPSTAGDLCKMCRKTIKEDSVINKKIHECQGKDPGKVHNHCLRRFFSATTTAKGTEALISVSCPYCRSEIDLIYSEGDKGITWCRLRRFHEQNKSKS